MSDERPNLRKLAAESLNRSCKSFLGKDSKCDLVTKDFEDGKMSFDEFTNKMEEAFSLHTRIEPKPVVKKDVEDKEEV